MSLAKSASTIVLILLCGVTGFSQLTRNRAPNNEPSTQTPDRRSTTSTTRPAPSSPITSAQQVPGAARTSSAVSSLSLEQAISLAIDNNLATLLAKERQNEARGFQKETRSGLLPNISGTAYQASLTENLAALGFTGAKFPGITSTFIGPFKNFDARARFQQTIFNLSVLRNYQAGRASVRAAQFEEAIAREQVATAAALAYLESLRADRSVAAAEANLNLAQTLLQLAQDQRDAGVATGVDVTRAQTRLAQEQVRLSRAQTDDEEARLQLERIAGLPLGSSFSLTDPLRFATDALPAIETAVATAEDTRAEIRAAEAQLNVNQLEARAVRAEQLPSLEFLGDYGISGVTPANSALPTRRYAIQLDVPIFNGGLTRGRMQVATAREREAQLQLDTVRGQVAEDVRLAYSALRTTADTVRAADQAVTLAERELQMAQDRYRAGVGDSIELVTAQTTLANARLDQVAALATYNGARLNLAAALGRAQNFRW